jgi:hypothetical protein
MKNKEEETQLHKLCVHLRAEGKKVKLIHKEFNIK